MPDNSPKISIIVPTFNRAKYLGECLDSLLAQTLPAVQVIVVNDGSSDDTKNICDAYGTKIIYFETPQLGKPGAINFGLEKAVGDYIWIFDDDDVALPDALARFVAPLEKNPEYGFSFSAFFYTGSDPVTGRIGEILFELRIPDLKERGFLIPLLESNFLGGAGLFARAACYKEAGYFDPALLRSQDYEMAIRIARRFKGVRVNGGATFHYRQHTGERGASVDRFTLQERGRKWLEYDQKFFRKLYHELPLSEYLFPGDVYPAQKRQALLQRLAIMAMKLLLDEVRSDLNELAGLEDVSPVSSKEYDIIRDMIVRTPGHGAGEICDSEVFFKEISRLAKSSPVIRLLRPKIFRAVLARWKKDSKIFGTPGAIKRSLLLWSISR